MGTNFHDFDGLTCSDKLNSHKKLTKVKIDDVTMLAVSVHMSIRTKTC